MNAVAITSDGRLILSGGDDKTVLVWEAASGIVLFTHRKHTGKVQTVAWSPDGRYIASGSDDKTVQVWMPIKAKSGFFNMIAPIRSELLYRGHSAKVNALMWSPNGQRLASVGADKTLQVWNASSGKKYFIYRNSNASLNAVAWSPDSRFIASGGNDKMVQIWDSTTRHSLSTYHGHTAFVTAVSWSPDGRLLASASVDRSVQVWEKR